MIKPRRSFPVKEESIVPQDSRVFISLAAPEAAQHGRYVLSNGRGTVYAYCDSAKRLSDFAFEEGAFEVTSDYNLKLSDGEA